MKRIKSKVSQILGISRRHNELVNRIKFLEDESKNLNYKLDVLIKNSNFPRPFNLQKTSQEKTKILLCGFYGVVNYGDDLMMRGIIKALNKEKIDLTIMICGNEETDFSAYPNVNVIYLPIQKIDIKLMSNYYDGIIWGGGTIIDDGNYNYTNYNLNLSTIFIHLTKAFQAQNKISIIYGVSSIKNINNPVFISELKNIVEKANLFTVRDKYTIDDIKKLGLNTNKIKIVNDIVFSYENLLLKTARKQNDINIVVDFNLKDENEEYYFKLIKKVIDKIDSLNMKKVKIIFQPYYSFLDYDRQRMNKLKERINDSRISVGEYLYTVDDFIELSKNTDYFIVTRYHTSILANCLGKPLLFVNYDIHKHYHNKNLYLSEEYGFNKNSIFMSKDLKVDKNIEELFKTKQTENVSKTIIDKAIEEISEINDIIDSFNYKI